MIVFNTISCMRMSTDIENIVYVITISQFTFEIYMNIYKFSRTDNIHIFVKIVIE